VQVHDGSYTSKEQWLKVGCGVGWPVLHEADKCAHREKGTAGTSSVRSKNRGTA